jgi:uncharacterized protein
MNSGFSRRSFLEVASNAAALWALDGLPATASPATAPATARDSLREFDYRDVRLTGGPLKEQYDQIHAHYLALDNDRLLKVYRQHAGLAAPGKDMGGWYDADGFVPGHSLGQYISGLARIGSCTGDAACHAKVGELVQQFGAVTEANANPFAGPSSEKVWPAYVMDKHVIGLIDAYKLSNIESARALLPRVVEGALPFVSPVSRDRIGKKDPPYDETYVLPENLFTAAEMTGDRRYRELAVKYLLDKEYFDPLAAGEDVLPSKHAYSHAIALSSAAKAYFELGEPKYKAAIVNASRFLAEQRFASGGFGPDEQFVRPGSGALFDSLTRTKDHFETPCGSYAAMKLARYLLRATGDARYGDDLERVVYNALLAVKQPDDDGGYPYYSTYGVHAVKEFYPHKWPCCSGTLVQGVADYVLNLYFHSTDGVYVNMFAPSEVTWSRGGSSVKLVQETSFPTGDSTTLYVHTTSPVPFVLGLRVPGWVRDSPEIRINGVRQAGSAKPGSFATLARTWKNADRIEMHLPQSFRTEAIDRLHPETVALMRGPVLYAHLNQTTGASDKSAAVPFYQVQNETYGVYVQKT